MELLQSELTELRTTQAKTAKESEKYKEERDAVYSEYKLIMSERDQVISELDKLQTEVELAESKLKSSTSEKKAASEEMAALRQVEGWALASQTLAERRGREGCGAHGVQRAACTPVRVQSLSAEACVLAGSWALQETAALAVLGACSDLCHRDARGGPAVVSASTAHSVERKVTRPDTFVLHAQTLSHSDAWLSHCWSVLC